MVRCSCDDVGGATSWHVPNTLPEAIWLRTAMPATGIAAFTTA